MAMLIYYISIVPVQRGDCGRRYTPERNKEVEAGVATIEISKLVDFIARFARGCLAPLQLFVPSIAQTFGPLNWLCR